MKVHHSFTNEQLEQANQLVNKKQKIYYPWYGKYITRVVRKDWNGFYVQYKGERLECRPMLDGLDINVIGFLAIKNKGG